MSTPIEMRLRVPQLATREEMIERAVDLGLDEYWAEIDRRAGGHVPFNAADLSIFRGMLRTQLELQIPRKVRTVRFTGSRGQTISGTIEEV